CHVFQPPARRFQPARETILLVELDQGDAGAVGLRAVRVPGDDTLDGQPCAGADGIGYPVKIVVGPSPLGHDGPVRRWDVFPGGGVDGRALPAVHGYALARQVIQVDLNRITVVIDPHALADVLPGHAVMVHHFAGLVDD